MPKFIIKQDREKCIGCGTCVALCNNWLMDKEGKAKPKKSTLDKVGCNQEAADACPTQCIEIVEK